METRVSILGLDVDILTDEYFQEKVQEYLSNEYLNIIHFVSMDYIEHELSENVRMALSEADMVLPGEKSVLEAHHVDVLEAGGMIVDYHNAFHLVSKDILQEKKVYFVMRNKSEAKHFYTLMRERGFQFECVGIYAADGKVSQETLVNDINTVLPDVIIVSLEKEEQEKWIHENRQKLNAKLCLCIGSIMSIIRRQSPVIPKFFKVLHLEGLYKWFLKLPNSRTIRKRMFKKRMAKMTKE